ncbi:MAG: 2-oxoglutarate dehydrogenase E1 component [Gammaproteobacteria bacterium]|jgi:2-oxoglutarate dehydrogenase E1 component
MSTTIPSFLYSANADFIEDLYESFISDPTSVPDEWQKLFESLQDEGSISTPERSHSSVRKAFLNAAKTSSAQNSVNSESSTDNQKQVSVLQLINAHRFRGHQQANLDPLNLYQRPPVPELDPEFHNLTKSDLNTIFNTGSLFAENEIPLSEILNIIRSTYCGNIGAEYMHINETEQKRWIQQRLEETKSTPKFNSTKKRRILNRVIAANSLEEYLHTRYAGQKRFSLEGGESLIPLLDEIVQNGGQASVEEVVIGMAHRGRLNVLVNIIGKMPEELFGEFEGKLTSDINLDDIQSGDVKYHLGYSSDIQTSGGPVHLTLAFNPSHLEIIDPVVEGSVRARQDRRDDKARDQVLPILLHGDAAFAGQGVVMETFQLSQTPGYSTGGTIHIIVNNQIGFTTSDPLDSRSTLYCTDVAKLVQAPIFHVNGDDPEAVVFVAKLALDFRMEFKKDVVIDMVCYRKHGHSEADEPAATQPLMYQQIRSHPNIRQIYSNKLIEEGIVTQEIIDEISSQYIDSLDSNETVAGPKATNINMTHLINFTPFQGTSWRDSVSTAITNEEAKRYSRAITTFPESYKLHPTVQKIINNRKLMGNGELAMDWGFAECMAYASLVDKGHAVRLSGQDSGRGTFFHRHAVIHNQEDGDTYLPLQHIREGQANYLVINSILSEEAVLAFEYGYSSSEPRTLVIWEAQFGDFANGAQVVFDQFISSCESKWGRVCGLTVMLPHGYDGAGPEHSSARLERFLQLCARENIQVCVPSTPAQMFHMLRRQVIRPYRKPLIIMSPKSLLRHKLSASPIDALVNSEFQLVIDEIDELDSNAVTRLLICSGKVYFDLLEQRRENKIPNIAIARLEQLFPFPSTEIKEMINNYTNLEEIVWVQEEPKNQGSWYYMQSRGTMIGCLGEQHTFGYAGRFYAASPATGSMKLHLAQQKKLIEDALQLDKLEVTTHKRALN